jgi:hypothetical protein
VRALHLQEITPPIDFLPTKQHDAAGDDKGRFALMFLVEALKLAQTMVLAK